MADIYVPLNATRRLIAYEQPQFLGIVMTAHVEGREFYTGFVQYDEQQTGMPFDRFWKIGRTLFRPNDAYVARPLESVDTALLQSGATPSDISLGLFLHKTPTFIVSEKAEAGLEIAANDASRVLPYSPSDLDSRTHRLLTAHVGLLHASIEA